MGEHLELYQILLHPSNFFGRLALWVSHHTTGLLYYYLPTIQGQ